LEDLKRTCGYQKPVPVPQLEQEYLSDVKTEFSDVEQVVEVDALALVCWNCRKEGRYHDCVEKRKIFCYDCGTPNSYKPSYQKCQEKNVKNNSRVFSETSQRCQSAMS
ncbi:hypothetical protein KR038_006606, partial [Drosophila bunnanda]